MKSRNMLIGAGIAAALAVLATGAALSAAQDKYTLKVPGGLAFSEFRGYESWQVINVSQGMAMAVILGNPAMIAAYQAGIPENGKPFPDGAKMAKIHWAAKKNEGAPGSPTVGGPLLDVDFMVKDSKRFADSGGWGYAVFRYDAASESYKPGDLTGMPPQGNDARCGAACHTIVQNRDYVFSEYGQR